ncbi:MAG: ATP cone domain-containing protein [Cyclonatronaceae bacterium]
MSRRNVRITKASGEKVPFSEEKLRNSLERSGATETQIERVVDEVEDHLYEGITTGKIYRRAYQLLRKRSRSNAARYKLKKAIMELGPSGYPFERFVGAILEQQGFRTEVGVLVEGKCVIHEIDVMAWKNSKLIMVECKFHNRPGVKCDVKVPLYIHSRFRDVVLARNSNGIQIDNDGKSLKDSAGHDGPGGQDVHDDSEGSTGSEGHDGPDGDGSKDLPDFLGSDYFREYEGWIVTNTRFTDDAISYGTCTGLVMTGWDFPGKNSLKHRIGLAGLHPLTCLSSLNRKEKEFLLENGIVLCRTVPEEKSLLRELGLSDTRIAKVERECDELVNELDVPHE